MSKIINLHIDAELDNRTFSFYETFITSRYTPLIDQIKNINLWSHEIHQIVFCLDIRSYLKQYNQEHGTHHSLTMEKEYSAVTKNLYHPNFGITILVPIPNPENADKFNVIDKLFLNQVMIVKANELLPKKFDAFKEGLSYDEFQKLDSIIHFLFVSWFPTDFTRSIIHEIDTSEDFALTDHNEAMAVFKRKLKRILYDSNSDDEFLGGNWQRLLSEYVIIFRDLVNRILENYTNSNAEELKITNEKEAVVIYGLVDEIRKNKTAILNNEQFDLSKIKYLFQDFARLFNIHILQRELDGTPRISINMYTNPKKLFHGDLIETENKFVAFIDILGFTKMIQEYDTNPISPLLQDVHKALNHSLDETVRKFGGKLDETFLEHKLFSDCLCVSIPFFDSKADYTSSIGILISLVKTYQNNMMKKGYFVRGAIAVGSYFSDENMIFSGGLVKAYNLETYKAIYPRIIIEDTIVSQLRIYHTSSFPTSITNEIIESPKEGIHFVNPFINVTQAFTLFQDMVTDTILNADLEGLSKEDDQKVEKGKGAINVLLGMMYDSHSEKESDKFQVDEVIGILNQKISELPIDRKIGGIKKWKMRLRGKQLKTSPRQKLIWLKEFAEWYLQREESDKYKMLK